MSSPGIRSVALVSPGWPIKSNGIVSYTSKMYRSLRGAGVRCHVMANRITADHDDPDVTRVEIPGREISRSVRRISVLMRLVSRRRYTDWLYARRILARMDDLVRSDGLELLQMEESNGWVRRVATASGIPVVARLHGPWFLNGRANGAVEDAAYFSRVEAERQGIESADGVTAPSRDVIDQVRSFYGIDLPRARAIPNPIDLVPREDRWDPEHCEAGRILFVGRFDLHKGGDVMIRAFGLVRQRFPAASLTFVGPDGGFDGEDGRRWYLPEYLREHLDSGARAAVEPLGLIARTEIPPLRRRAMVTVVPSRYENFANTATEALAMGCPLVVSDTGGLAEMVEHERNGLRARAGDAEDLARQIVRILQDAEFAGKLGREAGDDAERRYHPERIVRETLDYYDGVIDLGKSGRT